MVLIRTTRCQVCLLLVVIIQLSCIDFVSYSRAQVTAESPAKRPDGLIAHWPLKKDFIESVSGRKCVVHGVTIQNGSAHFDGRDDWIEVVDSRSLVEGTQPFTLSAWIHTDEKLDDVLGDIASRFDAQTRHGFNFGLMNYSGVTASQSNWRNLHFGIDANTPLPTWVDCGRPGTNQQIKSLVVFQGDLYAGIWEPGKNQRGHVYRYGGGQKWIDCGSPDPSNAITGMAVYQGHLYAGSELYSGGGSSLPLSPNTQHGGRVYRYLGGKRWLPCGKVADVRSISGMASYQGKLYVGTGTTGAWRDRPRRRGMYRFDGLGPDGAGKWTSCGCPDLRVVHLAVFNGDLLGLSYDDGGFFRYDGSTNWTRLGPIPDSTQAYSSAVYQSKLHVGTWPTGSVFRFDGPQKWTHRGRLGNEKEVMGMAVYNGQLYAGTLPKAEIYRYLGGNRWQSTGQLDRTPNVRYRRAWTTAVFNGKLFCGVLPSGRVYSLQVGANVTYDRALSPGWHHVAAVRDQNRLGVYIDGKPVAQSDAFDSSRFHLRPTTHFRIGSGQHDHFNGRIKDFRVYSKALSSAEIRAESGT